MLGAITVEGGAHRTARTALCQVGRSLSRRLFILVISAVWGSTVTAPRHAEGSTVGLRPSLPPHWRAPRTIAVRGPRVRGGHNSSACGRRRATGPGPARGRSRNRDVSRRVSTYTVRNQLLEVRACREVLVLAVQRAQQQVKGRLSLGYVTQERVALAQQSGPPCYGAGGRHHVADGVETQSGFLGAQDHRDAHEVVVGVAAPAAAVPLRLQQAHGFPVPQDMRRQAESFGEGSDGDRLLLVA